ncbi:MAG: hypothetical protein ACJ763_13120 [Bdellovibrionia bacterium]
MKNVKTTILLSVLAILGSSSAFAQGGAALCGTFDRELMVQIGPKNAMTLIDPSASRGHQTLAKFTQVDVKQSQFGPVFEANTRGAQIPNPEILVGGARLAELQWVTLSINVASPSPTTSQGIVPGNFRVQKANGQVLQKLMTCAVKLPTR